MTSLLLLILASPAFTAQSSAPQTPKREPPDGLGWQVARLNDVDGDHCADFALDDREEWIWVVSGKSGGVIARAPSEGKIRITSLGSDLDEDGAFDFVSLKYTKDGGACIRSGRTLQAIRTLELTDKSAEVHLGSIRVSDRNGDGVLDIIAVDRNAKPQSIVVFSGRTGQEVERISGRDGCSLGPLACRDLDTDGKCEIAVGKSRTIWSILHPEDRAEVLLFGPDRAACIGSITEKVHRLEYAANLFVPDVDGDGKDDLLVVQDDVCTNAERAAISKAEAGHKDLSGLALYSSRTLLPVRALVQANGAVFHANNVSLARLADLDGDGIDELGTAFDADLQGYARVFTGKTGAELRGHIVEKAEDGGWNCSSQGHFGVSIFRLGDTDGDGVEDYAIGSSGGVDGHGRGCVSVYSGKTGKLLRVIWKRDLLKN